MCEKRIGDGIGRGADWCSQQASSTAPTYKIRCWNSRPLASVYSTVAAWAGAGGSSFALASPAEELEAPAAAGGGVVRRLWMPVSKREMTSFPMSSAMGTGPIVHSTSIWRGKVGQWIDCVVLKRGVGRVAAAPTAASIIHPLTHPYTHDVLPTGSPPPFPPPPPQKKTHTSSLAGKQKK